MTSTIETDVSASRREEIFSWAQGNISYRAEGRVTTYRVVRPSLDVWVERPGRRWVVREGVTGIFGQGSDAWSAAKDFNRALDEHREVLERQPELSPALQAQLEYLKRRS